MSESFNERVARAQAEQEQARQQRAREAKELAGAARKARAEAERLLPELRAAVAELQQRDKPKTPGVGQQAATPFATSYGRIRQLFSLHHRPGETPSKQVGLLKRRTVPVPPSVMSFDGWEILLRPLDLDREISFSIAPDTGAVSTGGRKTIDQIAADGLLPVATTVRLGGTADMGSSTTWHDNSVSAALLIDQLLSVIASYLAAQPG